LKKDRIAVRSVRITDAKQIAEIYRPYVEKTAVSFEYIAPDEDEIKNRIEKITEKYPYIAAVINGEIIGYCYASSFKDRAAYDRSVEISIYLRSDFRGRGTGTLLYKVMEKKLREMGIKNIYACIAFPESDSDPRLPPDSILFHGKMGYTLCGYFRDCGEKFGETWSMVWMEKQL